MNDAFVSQTLFWTVTSIVAWLCAIVIGLISYIVKKNDEKVNEIWGDIDMIRADVSSNKSFLEGKLTDMIKEFQVGVDTLKSAVSEMREYISVVKTEHSEKIKSIEKDLQDQKCWLEADDKELSEHAIKIAEIKTMCESQHNRRK